MPYSREHATAQALLHNSAAKRRFDGEISKRAIEDAEPPPVLHPADDGRMPTHIVAIDGSNLSSKVANGYPGAEAALVQIALVIIDLKALRKPDPRVIPSPRVFRELEQGFAIDEIIPGTNIIGKGREEDSPRRYFRKVLGRALERRLTRHGETLAETLAALAEHAQPGRPGSCPLEDCEESFTLRDHLGAKCPCGRFHVLHQDLLRLHERFLDERVEPRLFDEVRHVFELLALVNVLRYFDAEEERRTRFAEVAFVLDGPLAVFGAPARLMRPVRAEIQRIDARAREHTGFGLTVFGIEKSGAFVEHFKTLDDRDRIKPKTLYALDTAYTHRHIVLRPEGARPHGETTYFGRKLFYKTRFSSHIVVNTAMTNKASENLSDVSSAAFPRASSIVSLVDRLATQLYPDAFLPLVRAHAHAAIPVRQGGDILESIFQKQS